MLKLLCLLFGHKKLVNLNLNKFPHSPLGIGHFDANGNLDGTYYPVWPCDRCNLLYIDMETKLVCIKLDEKIIKPGCCEND